jgi:hypothetical protein
MKKGLLFAALGACLVLASIAMAAAATTGTTFKMKDRGDFVEYSGKVTSDPSKTLCISGRRVQVFHQGIQIAETVSDANGNWKVDGPRPPVGDDVGVFIKKVKRHGKTRCKPASVTSPFG